MVHDSEYNLDELYSFLKQREDVVFMDDEIKKVSYYNGSGKYLNFLIIIKKEDLQYYKDEDCASVPKEILDISEFKV